MSNAEPQPRTTPVHAIADPAPLGLAGFAMTTLVLSCFNAGFLDKTAEGVVLPLALFYGGLGQLLAGMWEFRRGNTFGATAFSSFGAFWLAYYVLVKDIAPTLAASADAHAALGLFLLAWGIFTAYMAVAAVRVSGAVLGVFVALTLTFVVLAIGEFAKNDSITKVGGWLGLVTAALAWYASFAGVVSSTFGRAVLPTWPAKPAA
ncbi:succinate-acetate transporter protein [Streptacidiphilus sp. MAP12-16]|uniref:acetate uptake transporter n=1 Tax=Streptacidiphilus sp. MAP12-16 TaxID=3156300 RepID=UPI0035132E05